LVFCLAAFCSFFSGRKRMILVYVIIVYERG
jgi:hypothetical protein